MITPRRWWGASVPAVTCCRCSTRSPRARRTRRSSGSASRAAALPTRVRGAAAVPALPASLASLPAPVATKHAWPLQELAQTLCFSAPCAAGTLEDFDEAGAGAGASKAETAEEAAARAKLEAAKARESVRCAARRRGKAVLGTASWWAVQNHLHSLLSDPWMPDPPLSDFTGKRCRRGWRPAAASASSQRAAMAGGGPGPSGACWTACSGS